MSLGKTTIAVVVALAAGLAMWLLSGRSTQPEQQAGLPVASEEALATNPTSDPPGSPERRDWFPDLTQRAPASTTIDASAASRFGCSVDSLADYYEETDYEDDMRRLAETLSRSASAEDLLASALLRDAEEADRRSQAMLQALAADPEHRLVLWWLANDCRYGRGGEYCNDPTVRDRFDNTLGSNGWYWVQRASWYHEQGLFDQSLDAVWRAVAAPEFDDYFVAHAELLERAFRADSDRRYVDRMSIAIGLVAAMPADFLTSQCRSRPELDDAWLDACLQLMQRYEYDGTNLLMRMVGLGVQKNLYAQAGMLGAANDAGARESALRSVMQRVDADYALIAGLDPQVMVRHMEVWASSGEASAIQQTADRVDALLQDPDYDPCVFLPSP